MLAALDSGNDAVEVNDTDLSLTHKLHESREGSKTSCLKSNVVLVPEEFKVNETAAAGVVSLKKESEESVRDRESS